MLARWLDRLGQDFDTGVGVFGGGCRSVAGLFSFLAVESQAVLFFVFLQMPKTSRSSSKNTVGNTERPLLLHQLHEYLSINCWSYKSNVQQ